MLLISLEHVAVSQVYHIPYVMCRLAYIYLCYRFASIIVNIAPKAKLAAVYLVGTGI